MASIAYYLVFADPSNMDARRIEADALEQLALDPSVPPADMTTTGDHFVFEQFVGMLDVFDAGFDIVLP